MAFLFGKRYYAVNTGMSFKQGRNLFIKYEVYLCIWKASAQGVEQSRAEYGIAHLTESYDEYLVQFTVHSSKDKEFLDFVGEVFASFPCLIMLLFHG